MTQHSGKIRVGIGGWTFEPWRDTFYPPKLAQAKELGFASRAVTAIEINGTYYGTQKPASFRKWHDETPDDFVFSLKASRFCTNRKVLAEAGGSVEKFLTSGLTELGDKLGPILWQFPPTKQFDEADFSGFLRLLPKELEGRRLRHALEVRHDSFLTKSFIDLARAHEAAIVYADSAKYPAIADLTGGFVYARLQQASEDQREGYAPEALDRWTSAARRWSAGQHASQLPLVDAGTKADGKARDVFMFMINGAKVRAPHAAKAVLQRLKD